MKNKIKQMIKQNPLIAEQIKKEPAWGKNLFVVSNLFKKEGMYEEALTVLNEAEKEYEKGSKESNLCLSKKINLLNKLDKHEEAYPIAIEILELENPLFFNNESMRKRGAKGGLKRLTDLQYIGNIFSSQRDWQKKQD